MVNPDYALAHNNLGVIYNDTGRFEESVKSLRRAVDLNPDFNDGHTNLALALFRLPYAFQPIEAKDVHSAIRDGAYHNLVRHVPRTSAEHRLWQKFRNATRFYAVFMTGCLLLLMALLAAGYGARPCGSGSLVLLVMPAAMYFTLNRFDIVPALLTASSLACLGRRRIVAAAVMLAVAALVKVYPLLLAPLVVRYLWDDRRSAQTWVATFALTLVACSLVQPVGRHQLPTQQRSVAALGRGDDPRRTARVHLNTRRPKRKPPQPTPPR